MAANASAHIVVTQIQMLEDLFLGDVVRLLDFKVRVIQVVFLFASLRLLALAELFRDFETSRETSSVLFKFIRREAYL